MTTVLTIKDVLTPDELACRIANRYQDWEMRRTNWLKEKEEIQRYVFATDTTKTSNSKLPWSNKTTIPKLCQIRDNLSANYLLALFPKRKWMIWEGNTEADEDIAKKRAIEGYMTWVVDRKEFYDEMSKLVLDYIDYGNCFATVDWVDKRNDIPDPEKGNIAQTGYVGPMVRRISPVDILFNPAAMSFASSPKIIRSLVSLGEVKEILERQTNEDGVREAAQELYNYMKEIRAFASQNPPDAIFVKDAIYEIAGFGTFRDYLLSDYVEILTFMGDIYDKDNDEFLRNQVIRIVDRHKVLSKDNSPTSSSTPPIFHAGWRLRPDNLWAMGPLDNLVGMQYRIDHLENLKADVFDLIAYPPLEIRGYVDDFTWGPFERIYTSEEGQVNLLSPNVQALQADTQIAILEQKMEEMAGAPKEALGFRTPGEKTKYEVQRLENAASRIFQNKITQYERQIVENVLNAMLEMARRKVDASVIRIFNNEMKIAQFETLTAEDITGNGQLHPIAARHFAEQAQLIQDLSQFYQTGLGQDPDIRMHFSSVKLARIVEGLLSLEDYNVVQPYVRITEHADAQLMMNIAQEQTASQTMTPSGLHAGDYNPDIVAKNMDGALANGGDQGGTPQGPPNGLPGQAGPAPKGNPATAQAGAY